MFCMYVYIDVNVRVFLHMCVMCVSCVPLCVCICLCACVCVRVCVGAGWVEAGCEPSDEADHEENAGIHPRRLALPRTGWT